MRPYSLWDTKEDASNYVDLFVWYKSVRTKIDPLVPEPHGKWFKTAVPDCSWDEIRDYLSNNLDRAYASKKRKFSTIAFSADIKRAKRAMYQEDKKAELPTAVQTLPQMRKKYSSLGTRQKTDVQKSVKILVKNHWSLISPTYPEELIKCPDDMGPKKNLKTNDCVTEAISQSYMLAHDRKDEERKTEILSMFILQKNMTREKLENIMGMEVSGRKYNTAKYHAILYGAGQGAKEIIHHRGGEVKRSIVKKFVAFLMENGVMTANGRTVHITGKESVSVPNIKRLEGKQPLIRAFEERERRIRSILAGANATERTEWMSLRRQSMEEVIAVTCPEKHASMAALDVVGQLHGVINFKVLTKKLVDIATQFEELKEKTAKLFKELKEVEETLANKNKFRSQYHFCGATNNSGPACHCHYYAFGKVDPIEMLPGEGDSVKSGCGHYHRGGCAMCNQIDNLGNLIDDLEAGVSDRAKEKFNELNIRYHKQIYLHYKGHQARLAHESQVPAHIKERLKSDTSLMSITADYAMKVLPLKDSEAQNEFFGKAGINWHGICILWYDPARQQYFQYYVTNALKIQRKMVYLLSHCYIRHCLITRLYILIIQDSFSKVMEQAHMQGTGC
jgi:hypothetical protein